MKSPKDLIRAAKDAINHPFCFPGGYTKAVYLADGDRLCRDCLLRNWDRIYHSEPGWEIGFVSVYWEGPDDYCADCSEPLPSEYGDPDAPEAA